MITNKGISILMNRFLSATYSKVSEFKVGIDSTPESLLDTDLKIPIPIQNTEQVDDCETANWTDSTDCTTSLNSSYFKEGSNGLNLVKDGTTSTECSTSKTTTSLDFTNKDLSIWIYLSDQTTLDKILNLKIRFGSDSSNYYEWIKNNSDLSLGWNLIVLNSTTGTQIGTVILNSADYSYINFISNNTSDTWASGKIVMDDWKLISSDDYLDVFEIGYPSIDETTNQITYRIVLNSLKANNYNLQEIGLFNSDDPNKIWSRNTFTPISKSDTEEIRIIIKDQFSIN